MTWTSRLAAGWLVLALGPVAMAQTPPAKPAPSEDLDVTMRVIVDPNAKVPDEIVRRIPLPQPKSARAPGTPPDNASKPAGSDAREQGREFGQDVAAQARQRAEEARRNAGPPGDRGPAQPPGPPADPPGPPVTPPRGPPAPPPAPPGG
jgi:hypothetical protein